MQRAEARLERAIQARNAAEWDCARASSDLDNARRSLDICSTPRFSEEKVLVRDCSAEEAAVLRAEEYYQGAQKELQAAEVEVRSAREEINQAQARIACCNQGVGYAEKANVKF